MRTFVSVTLVSSRSDDLSAHGAHFTPSSAPNTSYSEQYAPRTRTRLPCTPALAPSNRNSGRARSPRTSPTARAMGRQRARPSPCPATQGTAPPTSARTRAPIPHACTAGATPCKAVSRLSSPISPDVRLPPPHRSEQAAKASRRQRRSSSPSTRHIRARSRGYHHHGGICHHHG